jgi:hypothetical protein
MRLRPNLWTKTEPNLRPRLRTIIIYVGQDE